LKNPKPEIEMENIHKKEPAVQENARQDELSEIERETRRMEENIERLTEENAMIRAGLEKQYQEKLASLSKIKQIQMRQEIKEDIYRLIETNHQENNWPVRTMCEIFGVSRASFYKWQNRKDAAPDLQDALLEEKIRQIALSNNRAFGVRRMMAELNKEPGISVGFKKVYRLMSRMDLLAD
jgi:transposase